MKILLVHNFYREPGGEDVVFAQERRLLERKGHQVITYTRSNEEAENGSAMDRVRLFKIIVSSDQSRDQMLLLLRTERPDVVHVHNTFMMISPSIYEACVQENIPAVVTIHNYRLLCPAAYLFREGKVCEECIDHSLLRGIQHGCYRESRTHTAAVATMLAVHRIRGTWSSHVKAFIALTDFARHKLAKSGVPMERIYVKPNFVEHDPGQRREMGEYALFVGRLSPEKGLDTLIGAWAEMGGKVPLKIVGDGPMRLQLTARIAREGIQNVEILGRLDQAAIRETMKKSCFVVLPSVWYEGFPMVLAESFACGVPVIGSRLGAMEEVIEDGQQGLHFAVGDANDLREKALWAWEHPPEVRAMGFSARSKYERLYGVESSYETMMNIYDNVCG